MRFPTTNRVLFLGLLKSRALCCRTYCEVNLKKKGMSISGRHFVNQLPHYDGGEVRINIEDWKKQILRMAYTCAEKLPVNPRNMDGGLYVGCPGIAYMFYHLGQSNIFADKRIELFQKGLDIVEQCEVIDSKSKNTDITDSVSFILGRTGLLAVSAALHAANGNMAAAEERLQKYVNAASICKPVNFVNFGGDELFVGRAGYICGAMWLRKVFQRDVVPKSDLIQICNSIIESGKSFKSSFRTPLMYTYYNTGYLGAAHGLSSILQMLLSCPHFIETTTTQVKDEISMAVDFLLSLQTPSGNFPCATDEIGRSRSEELVHWCHGAPGVVYLMAKAYLSSRNEKYLQACIKCADLTWEKGLLLKGPGICHGIAGSGYVFLILYRLTNDKAYLFKAHEFAKFMNSPDFRKARTPDSPYSLYEGYAGTVCFLSDMLNPEIAAFPFMDVFT